jgi:SHS2 domain-containing protein
MPYEYLDHIADIGIRGIGATIEQAFSEGALAMLAAMANVDTVRSVRSWPIRCAAPDIPFLFVEWLNEILYQREVNAALFNSACVACIEQNDTGWTLQGAVHGEALDAERHETYTEIKGATMSGLEYHGEQGHHVIQCILDV